MNDWHVWTVVTNRQKRIKEFLSELNGVEDFLYPMAEKEYVTKNGKKTKDVPIYANYIFIKYTNDPRITMAIEQCPWISTYVGMCSTEEMAMVQCQDKSKYEELIDVEKIREGDIVKLVQTPFAGWEATVVSIEEDRLSVSITILGAERIIKCNIDDINVQ